MIILIYGPQAVGKMTVGQSLASQLKYGMVHDHMILDIAARIYPYHSIEFYNEKRCLLLDIARRSIKNKRGLVLTRTFDFNCLNDQLEIDMLLTLQKDTPIIFVGLDSSLGVRIKRNSTRNRLYHKPTKKNITRSQKRLILASKSFKYFPDNNILSKLSRHIYINNDEKKPCQVTKEIISYIYNTEEHSMIAQT